MFGMVDQEVTRIPHCNLCCVAMPVRSFWLKHLTRGLGETNADTGPCDKMTMRITLLGAILYIYNHLDTVASNDLALWGQIH